MKKIITLIFLILFCLLLYGKFIEINNFKVNDYTIKNENIKDNFKELKIVHFSDILYKTTSNKEILKDNFTKINEQDADIIVFTGDLFYKDEKYTIDDIKFLKENLKKLDASLFKIAIIGDNDKKYLDEYKDILYESDFTLLDNENKLLFYKDNTPINLIGITDTTNVEVLLETDIETNFTIAITHEPDNLENLSKYDINVILSGHSLGGVVNVPFYGGLLKKDGSNTYVDSYYKLNNTELYVSNGLGNEKYDFRLFNTPSINIYRLDN